MSRFDRLKNWPDKLGKMSLEELRKECAYWQMRIRVREFEQMPRSKELEKRVREVQREIDARESND